MTSPCPTMMRVKSAAKTRSSEARKASQSEMQTRNSNAAPTSPTYDLLAREIAEDLEAALEQFATIAGI